MDEDQQLAINGAIFDKLVICQKQREELLAALKEARRWIGDGDMSDDATSYNHWSDGYVKAISDVDAVIAKYES